MVKQLLPSKATLSPQRPRDASKDSLTPQQQAFVRLITTEGLDIKDAAVHPEVGVSVRTGYNWSTHPKILNSIAEVLQQNQQLNQLQATKELKQAWATIRKAMKNPNVTQTQLKAAIFVVMQANGATKTEAEKGVTFHLEVNTQLNTNALAEQQARHSQPSHTVYEGGFTVIGSDDPMSVVNGDAPE